MVNVRQLVGDHKELIIQTRRDLHQIPETGFTEEETSAYVADCLRKQGLDVRTGIARYGVVGLMSTSRPGPTLMIRADMDALPLQEETGLPFASTHKGIMHACGHDAHMAMVLGAAAVINRLKDHIKGHIKFLFQPAEEGPGGAKPMIEAGVMENPKVDYSVGCHVWPDLPEGTIGVKPGPFMAAMGRFDIRIMGKGGHGAMPHQCVDALEVGTQVVNAFQRIVSRQMDPLEPAVVTVGSFHSGTAFNIIPDQAILTGTTRTFNPDIWNSWEERIGNIVKGVCESMGARYEMQYALGFPPTVNDESMAQVIRRNAEKVVGKDQVVEPTQTLGGEDFAFYLQKSKGCYFALGVGRPGGMPVHNSRFDFREDLMLAGVETYCHTALELLG